MAETLTKQIQKKRATLARGDAAHADDFEARELAGALACIGFSQPSQYELECVNCGRFRDEHARGRRGKAPGQ